MREKIATTIILSIITAGTLLLRKLTISSVIIFLLFILLLNLYIQ